MAKSTKGTKDTKGSSTTGPAVKVAQPAPRAAQGAVKNTAVKQAKSKTPAADKTGSKKTVAKKAAPKKQAAAKKTAAKRALAPNKAARPITTEERHRMIAEAAYLRSEAQGFSSDQHSDWIAAEAEVDARLLQQNIDVVG